jgi:RNA polymerase sigma-70 factor, ECF subfamily
VLSGDQKLIERCLRGDDAAWEMVVKSYGKKIYNLSYRYVNRKDEAEDLTQDILIRVYQNLQSYRADAGSFQSWVLRIARNMIIDHYRQFRRYAQTGGSDELEALTLSDERMPNPQQNAEQKEACRFLREGLEVLAPELKEAVILRDLESMTYQEIAELLNIPEGTVKSRINRGRIELAKLLMKRRTQAEIRI